MDNPLVNRKKAVKLEKGRFLKPVIKLPVRVESLKVTIIFLVVFSKDI